jgi:hypothetical protein
LELKQRFHGAADFTVRELEAAGVECTLLFLDGLCSGAEIAEFVIRPLGRLSELLAPSPLLDWALAGGVEAASASRCADVEDAEAKLLNGFCILVVPGAGAAAYEVKTGEQLSFSIQPVSIIILDKQYENHEVILNNDVQR